MGVEYEMKKDDIEVKKGTQQNIDENKAFIDRADRFLSLLDNQIFKDWFNEFVAIPLNDANKEVMRVETSNLLFEARGKAKGLCKLFYWGNKLNDQCIERRDLIRNQELSLQGKDPEDMPTE